MCHLRHIPHIPEWEIRLVYPIRVYFTMHTYYHILTTDANRRCS